MTDTRLDHLDEDEWWDVARTIDPSLTRERFESDWAEFQRLKAERQKQSALS